MAERKVRLDQFRRLVGATPRSVDVDECARACYGVLYGLPRFALLSIGQQAIGRYFPVFYARQAWDVREMGWYEHWLSEQKPISAARWPRFLQALSEWREGEAQDDSSFLRALEAMHIVLRQELGAGQGAALVTHALMMCVDQRKGNVWAADQPVLSAVWNHEFGLGHAADEASYHARQAETDGNTREASRQAGEARKLHAVIQGLGTARDRIWSQFGVDLPADVTEWRELRITLEWLRPHVRKHPHVDEDALARDWKNYERDSWDYMAEEERRAQASSGEPIGAT